MESLTAIVDFYLRAGSHLRIFSKGVTWSGLYFKRITLAAALRKEARTRERQAGEKSGLAQGGSSGGRKKGGFCIHLEGRLEWAVGKRSIERNRTSYWIPILGMKFYSAMFPCFSKAVICLFEWTQTWSPFSPTHCLLGIRSVLNIITKKHTVFYDFVMVENKHLWIWKSVF